MGKGLSSMRTRLWKEFCAPPEALLFPVGGKRWLAGVGCGAQLQAHSRLCCFTHFCGLSVNCYKMCSLAPALKTTQALRQMQNAAPNLSPKPLPVGAKHALWSPQCWGPSQVSSKQVGPRTWSHTPAGALQNLERIQMVLPWAEDPHCFPGTDWGIWVPRNPGGSASCNWSLSAGLGQKNLKINRRAYAFQGIMPKSFCKDSSSLNMPSF